MSTSASTPHDGSADRRTDDTTVAPPTGPGPDSTHAASPTSGDGTGTAQPDTGPGPAAADVDDDGPDARR
ncbi:hypothetical protein [Cellulomonas sp. ATA003]|uniref:hypothetical protein n=1 Tax=Cellulomonas sp. ATA003 TaxID=3073064 RepID=UPI002873791B|nr:hypothetical protein [Cellulomonas sp. ATA003]WNB86629.1 hypothetical protein REH70_05200 [Cellulomonas sp. ATA003]